MKDFPYTPEQRAWIDDLKTTTEPQTMSFLWRKRGFSDENKAGFCCLGRICMLEKLSDETPNRGTAMFCGRESSLPEEIAAKYKLRDPLGRLKQSIISDKEKHTYTCLADLNDSAGWTFKQIAEYIEANPENVFTNLEESE